MPVGTLCRQPDGSHVVSETGSDRFGVTAVCLVRDQPDAEPITYPFIGWGGDPPSEADAARVRCEAEINRRSRVMAAATLPYGRLNPAGAAGTSSEHRSRVGNETGTPHPPIVTRP